MDGNRAEARQDDLLKFMPEKRLGGKTVTLKVYNPQGEGMETWFVSAMAVANDADIRYGSRQALFSVSMGCLLTRIRWMLSSIKGSRRTRS